MTQIEARVGGVVIFLFFLEWTPSVGQHRPMKVVKVLSTPTENVLFSLKNFRRPLADGSFSVSCSTGEVFTWNTALG
jgi:hypothetical protein